MTSKQASRLDETTEGRRIAGAGPDDPWRVWGPYLSERQWGTVREDYSADGDAWAYLPFEHARSRAYRWGEDGLAGFGEKRHRWCLGLALWNEKDPILKERLFGLNNAEGNHGEDVKELYYYLDGLPSHALMRMLYKYPQAAYPYEALVAENARRGLDDPEFELLDTGLFDEGRYFDVAVDYAKAAPDDILMRVTVTNRGPEMARLHVLPQLWARNIWSWKEDGPRPDLAAFSDCEVSARHPELPEMRLHMEEPGSLLFCDNDTNVPALYGSPLKGFFKDGIDAFVVKGDQDAVSPARVGTKCAVHHVLEIAAGGQMQVRLRFRPVEAETEPFEDFDAVFEQRLAEADEFYAVVQDGVEDEDQRRVQRQALAGLLWSKQLYDYDVRQWLAGDPAQPPPPAERLTGRNIDWRHLRNRDIICMPDKWEYPWYASWDLAFQALPLAMVDPAFAKEQLLLLVRDWYMHPNAQLPAYEWKFGDANPPVHAWATWRVYTMDKEMRGEGDRAFLEVIFQRLMMNFTWWVNRKDAQGRNLFQGGFLGLDNIEIFDRSVPFPPGWTLNQSDGTAWMALYALDLMRIALELAEENSVYEDAAGKLFEHFLYIAEAAAANGGLWDDEDGFFYDKLEGPDGTTATLRGRSLVGLIPLCAVEVLEGATRDKLPGFAQRLDWFLKHRPELAAQVSHWQVPGKQDTLLLSMLRGQRMSALLERMLDETEFLSDHGVRAVSKVHERQPFMFTWLDQALELPYWPGESRSRLFGGNSNWRGPVWMPINYLLIDSLREFAAYYGETYRVECPKGSGVSRSLREVADFLSDRLIGLFTRGLDGRRAAHGEAKLYQDDPAFRDHILFYEYFHGDTGRGIGASHQTGWSALVAMLIRQRAEPPPGKHGDSKKHPESKKAPRSTT